MNDMKRIYLVAQDSLLWVGGRERFGGFRQAYSLTSALYSQNNEKLFLANEVKRCNLEPQLVTSTTFDNYEWIT